jgi:hypothetical protein
VMDCGGAMQIGEGVRSAKRVLCDSEGASTALGLKRKGRGRQALSVEANGPVTDERDPPRPEWPGARTRAIITAQQPKSRGGPSRPPAHVTHYARGRGA